MYLYNYKSFSFTIVKIGLLLKLLTLIIAIQRLVQIVNLLKHVRSLQIPAGDSHLACGIKNREAEADVANVGDYFPCC